MNVYPNPVSTDLYVSTSDNGFHLLSATLYDVTGQQVYTETFLQKVISFNINSRAFSPGVYLLQLATDEGTIQKKIIVMR
jgi:hypothetical protein